MVISNHAIQRAYYFPNFVKYKEFLGELPSSTERSEGRRINPYFLLRPSLHQLLTPAIQYESERRQRENERRVGELVDTIRGANEEEELTESSREINAIARAILRPRTTPPSLKDLMELFIKNGDTAPYLLQARQPENALKEVYNTLGQFLIQYSLVNAMKSEVLSRTTRLQVLCLVTESMEKYSDNHRGELTAMDTIAPWMERILNEISRITLNTEEMLRLTVVYQYLSSCHEDVLPAAKITKLYGLEQLSTFLDLLYLLCRKKRELSDEELYRYGDLLFGLDHNLKYWIDEAHFPEEVFSEYIEFITEEIPELIAEMEKRENEAPPSATVVGLNTNHNK